MNIASALARCGSKTGFDLLLKYLNDIHFNFKYFAATELRSLTGKNYEYDSVKWANYLSGLNYPQPSVKLIKEKEY
ncbi:MAG: hypothetical protein GX126_09350, partial [Bacteroidales bacterium]|nr:hypothetical protein [Bacteroidales bacterium]